jgi:hypothetical protein
MRLHSGLVDLARIVEEVSEYNTSDATPDRKKKIHKLLSDIAQPLKPGLARNLEGQKLNTLKELLDPVTLNGDRFGPYFTMPMDEPSNNFNMTGVGSQAANRTAVFEPKNIVLLTDGVCGSTCSLFSYLMIHQKNISTTVIGGRPRLGPMQAIAGSEGAGFMHMQNMTDTARLALELASPELQKELKAKKDSNLVALAEGYALRRGSGTVNSKNNFSPHDSTTPLQFRYHLANCRLFWTRHMISGPELTWKRTVDGTWTDPDRFCVEGSRIGADVLSAAVADQAGKKKGDGVVKRDGLRLVELMHNNISSGWHTNW